jgi:hypothetical protein
LTAPIAGSHIPVCPAIRPSPSKSDVGAGDQIRSLGISNSAHRPSYSTHLLRPWIFPSISQPTISLSRFRLLAPHFRISELRFVPLTFGSLLLASIRSCSLRFAPLMSASVRFAALTFDSLRLPPLTFDSIGRASVGSCERVLGKIMWLPLFDHLPTFLCCFTL